MMSDFHADVHPASDIPDVLAVGEFHCFDCGQRMSLKPNDVPMAVRGRCWCGIVYEVTPAPP